MDDPTTVTTLIRDIGIPAAILVIVLLRIEPKLDHLIQEVGEMRVAVQLHVSSVSRASGPQSTKEAPG